MPHLGRKEFVGKEFVESGEGAGGSAQSPSGCLAGHDLTLHQVIQRLQTQTLFRRQNTAAVD